VKREVFLGLFLAVSVSLVAPVRSADEIKAELVQVRTDDGLTLHGGVWAPSGGSSRVGVALATGTGGEFYGTTTTAERFAHAGYWVVSLNRRDHGDNFGYYALEPSALDHRYAVDLLTQRGVQSVILVGQSYGTVTVPFYVAATDDPRVKGLILTAALGDLRRGSELAVGGKKAYDEVVGKAREMVRQGRGKESFLMPSLTPEDRPIAHSYAVFLDKRGPESKAVPYQLMRKIQNRPILAVRDPADPLPATLPPAQSQLEESNGNLTYVLLPDVRNGRMDRAAHGFSGREDELFEVIFGWLKKHGLTPDGGSPGSPAQR
jgi:pimeloyl-ACP methyl ester carboxylesterase